MDQNDQERKEAETAERSSSVASESSDGGKVRSGGDSNSGDQSNQSDKPVEAAAAVAAAPAEQPPAQCRGDPRMKAACRAKMDNPSLSLLDALKIGGFNFPQEDPTCEDFDVEGILLRQRKNQLCVSVCVRAGGGGGLHPRSRLALSS
jgi:hypothetical protein